VANKRLQAAFGTTSCAVLFTMAGVAGYAINSDGLNARFGHQTGHPVLSEIALGMAFAIAAVITWRRALKSL